MVSQHALQVSRPTPRGEVEGSGLGDFQAHTRGGGGGGGYASYWNAFLDSIGFSMKPTEAMLLSLSL